MVKNVRGWNCNEAAENVLKELEIPEKEFSKTMNKIIVEWHNKTKEPQKQEHLLEVTRIRV